MTEKFPGQFVRAEDNNDLDNRITAQETVATDEATVTGTTTSTSYTSSLSGASSIAVSFSGPPSGNAIVLMTAKLRNSSASDYTYMSWSLSGGTTMSAADERGIRQYGDSYLYYTSHYTLTGLEEGTSYTVTGEYKVSAGTGSVDDRRITIIPC